MKMKDFGSMIKETKIEPIEPVKLKWNPKEDITVYELAKAMPLLISSLSCRIYPSELSNDSFMRHFDVNDPNKK